MAALWLLEALLRSPVLPRTFQILHGTHEDQQHTVPGVKLDPAQLPTPLFCLSPNTLQICSVISGGSFMTAGPSSLTHLPLQKLPFLLDGCSLFFSPCLHSLTDCSKLPFIGLNLLQGYVATQRMFRSWCAEGVFAELLDLVQVVFSLLSQQACLNAVFIWFSNRALSKISWRLVGSGRSYF